MWTQKINANKNRKSLIRGKNIIRELILESSPVNLLPISYNVSPLLTKFTANKIYENNIQNSDKTKEKHAG